MSLNIKVGIVSHSDYLGGADRSAYRLHRALLKNEIDSTMFVDHAATRDNSVVVPGNKYSRFLKSLKPRLARVLDPLLASKTDEKLSTAFIPSGWAKFLNNSDVDVVHLHWPHNEMMSISDIGKITKPLVWTLHDMWAFCGAEHITHEKRFIEGYNKSNRSNQESGVDLKKWTWRRKVKKWQRPINIITPSNWMKDVAKSSYLMNKWSIQVIPNTIDTAFWSPADIKYSRNLLGLPQNRKILLFGAIGGRSNKNKGFEILKNALLHLSKTDLDPLLIIVGESNRKNNKIFGLDTFYLGHLHDDISMKLAYCSADVVLIPSKIENLPNMAIESTACGTPVVAFNTGGISDIIQHKINGWLAKKFEAADFADGIKWVFSNTADTQLLSRNARKLAVENFNEKKIVEMHMEIYNELINA